MRASVQLSETSAQRATALETLPWTFTNWMTCTGAAAADSGSESSPFGGGAPAGPSTWSGVYIGAHGGYGWSDIDYTLTVPGLVTEKVSHDADGWLFGGHLGAQRQFDRFVAGLEVSYSELDLSDTVASSIGGGRFREVNVDSLFTATARLGLARDHWLAYVKGGYAGADVEALIYKGGPPKLGSSDWENGWTIGAGIEFNCLSRFIVGLEYDYVSLDVDDRSGKFPPPDDKKPFTETGFDTDIQTIVARISYKFGQEPAPAPLK